MHTTRIKKRKKLRPIRIIRRTAPNGVKWYVIQKKHFLFRWIWVDASYALWTLLEASGNVCWYNGTPWTDEVVEILTGK